MQIRGHETQAVASKTPPDGYSQGTTAVTINRDKDAGGLPLTLTAPYDNFHHQDRHTRHRNGQDIRTHLSQTHQMTSAPATT